MFKKIKNKKTMIAIIVSLFVVVMGTTYALFFSNTSIANLFSVGNFNVVTTETFTSPASWQPGQEIPKSITATNNGDIQAAFRVKYTESWVDSNNNPISNVPANAVTINFINTRDWTYNSTDGYYYYNWIIEPGDTTKSLISGITLNQSLTGNASCLEDGNTYNCSSSISGLEGATYILTFTKETVIYSKYQSFWNTNQSIVEQPLYTLPYGRTESNLQVGDEICVNGDTTECFNFIRYDGNNIVMLAEYNLKVGNIYNSAGNTKTGEYSSSDTGYGLQSNEALGLVSGQNRYGTVAFSGTNYWYDGGALKSKYGSTYPADVYDTDYSDVSGTNYSVAYYVENYKSTLENYGLTVQSARLLTYSEATDSSIGCSGSSYSCPTTGFITNTTFWLGSARSNNGVWYVLTGGYFRSNTFSYDTSSGVRPVIEVAKSGVNGNYDNAEKESVPITIPSGRTKDNLEVGDEICIEGTTRECFNFYGYDGDDIKLLSKYNLNVGLNLVSGAQGVQNSGAIAWNRPQLEAQDSNYPALVAFSGSSYWQSGGTVLAKYGGVEDDNDIYDSSYIASPGSSDYSIAYYVEGYKDILESYGAVIKKARLLTYNEATTTADFDCNDYDEHCYTNGFLINTTFWLGSAHDETDIWQIDSEGGFLYYNTPYYDTTFNGVRPVIIISKSSL